MKSVARKRQRQFNKQDARLTFNHSARQADKIPSHERVSVRALTKSELVLCQPFVRAVIKESHASSLLAKTMEKNWAECTTEEHGVVLGLFSGKQLIGMLGAVLYAELNDAQLIARQFITYLRKGYRTAFYAAELLRTFEQWAYTCSAERIVIKYSPTQSHASLKLLYDNSGYKSEQVIYSKDLRDDDYAVA